MRRRIMDKVRHALAPGGYFVTGEAEREIVAEQKGLRAVTPPAAVFQKAVRQEG
jgi:chemotaxis methyl-accepting protein methylase